jgi:hypothetical protein
MTRPPIPTTAREDHDAWLEQDSVFARVINGNAFERHKPQRRVRRPSRIARAVRALFRWLSQPTPWSQR